MKNFIFLLTTLLGLLSTPSFAANISDNLKATIEGVVNEPSSIRFTIENTSPDLTIRFVSWHTPLEGKLTKDIFLIKLNGAIQPYLGRVVRRRPPNDSDYIILTPGEKVSQILDLSVAYDLSKPGDYSIQFRSSLLDVEVVTGAIKRKGNTSQNAENIQSESIRLNLSSVNRKAAPRKMERVASFSGCNTSQASAIQAAHDRATGLASESKNALVDASAASRPSAARYKKWFGTYSTARYDKVVNGFTKMSSALNTQTITYLCDCTSAEEDDGDYAYVYPNAHYNIHICNNTFSLGTTGSDTQAGTVIHELSHFTILGGTDDLGYGYNTALNLAISNPTNAANNAENYLFFAENIPNLTNGESLTSAPVTTPVITPILQLLL